MQARSVVICAVAFALCQCSKCHNQADCTQNEYEKVCKNGKDNEQDYKSCNINAAAKRSRFGLCCIGHNFRLIDILIVFCENNKYVSAFSTLHPFFSLATYLVAKDYVQFFGISTKNKKNRGRKFRDR